MKKSKKQIWREYRRVQRMLNHAEWYLNHIQPASISMNQYAERYKYELNKLKTQLWGNSYNN